jgi:membrane-associated protease RseP (regulator of RpoE activity)
MKSSKLLRIGVLPVLILLLMLIFQPPGIVLSSLGAATLHELGHVVAAVLLRIPMRSLEVGAFGASLRVRDSLIPYPKEFLLCASGPATNLLTATVIAAFSDGHGCYSEIGEWLAAVSLMLGILNLMPAEGFDGGRMLAVTLTSLFGPRVSARVLSFSTFISILALWMLSVYLLLRFGTSLSLFIFTLSLFYRLFIERS